MKAIHIVIYTTSSSKYDKKLAQQLGANYFLTKAFDYLEFKRTMTSIIRSLNEGQIHVPVDKHL